MKIIYPVNINNNNDIIKICSRIKTDTRALGYLIPKSNILHLYAENIDYRAAAFLKQELLARGGDTIVTKHVIDGKTDFSDILLMCTPSQLRALLEKLKAMDCWGLKEFREGLSAAYNNMNINEWVITSPNGHKLTLNNDTKIMAILNVTPDSFFGASRVDEHEILTRAERFLNEGASVLDVGAESTRPGALPVSEAEELSRLLPALKLLRSEFPDAVISVDTYKAKTVRAAYNEGADIINDISGFSLDDEMLKSIAELKMPYILSHIKGTPETMREHEPYENIIGELISYFDEKLKILSEAGLGREKVILDPGIGFGKSADDNFSVLKNIESFRVFGLPVMAGHSRKRFTGTESIAGTLAVSALMSGRVSMLRVHEVGENLRAMRIAGNIRDAGL